MQYAFDHPDKVLSLTVVDIAPKAYDSHWTKPFAAMNALDLDSLKSRGAAEKALEDFGIESWAMRKFLTTNLIREPDSGFKWQINLKALTEERQPMAQFAFPAGKRFGGPTLFLRGSNSDFIIDEDGPKMESHFPNYILMTIANAGHNVHVDNPKAFETAVQMFHERSFA